MPVTGRGRGGRAGGRPREDPGISAVPVERQAAAARLTGLRVDSFAAIVVLLIEYGLGVWVGLYGRLPASGHGASIATGFARGPDRRPARAAARSAAPARTPGPARSPRRTRRAHPQSPAFRRPPGRKTSGAAHRPVHPRLLQRIRRARLGAAARPARPRDHPQRNQHQPSRRLRRAHRRHPAGAPSRGRHRTPPQMTTARSCT